MERGSATRAGETREAQAAYRPGNARLWRRLGWRGGDLRSSLRDCLERELAERAGFQWLAVVFGFGCLVYFGLPREPLLGALLALAAGATILATRAYRRGMAWRLVTLLAAVLAGATMAKLRVEWLAGPHIEQASTAELIGRVVARDSRAERRPRIVLDQLRSTTVAAQAMPARIRLALGKTQGLPPLGATVTVRARIMPVAGPAVPGGYDPRRAAFFDGIGGSGFVLGSWAIVQPAPRFSADLAVERVRASIVARIMAAQPGEPGAVAAALLVGERSALSEGTNESLRISGLAHILSISGLHMMLIAGTAFLLVRAILALSPRMALRRPIRKWAALGALLVVTIYLTLSGGGAATVRSYVMAAVMFAAILLDRPALSMRNLAIAAFVVLVLEPESVVEPGFQMSFAAVAALIAGWEVWHSRQRAKLADENAIPAMAALRFLGRLILGVALTTLIAGSATAPFAAYHFERVATYSLLGNLFAAPLISAIVMPFGLLTLVVMPFGLEALPLWIMAAGIRALLAVSDWVAGLPGSDLRAPPMAAITLLPIVSGLLWLCLWRLRWRLLGVPAILGGFALVPLTADLPDILVAPEGTAIAVRDAAGVLRVSAARTGSYLAEQFFDEEAQSPAADALREGVACDDSGCILAGAGGLVVAHVKRADAFPEDCRRANVVVTALAAPATCRADLIIDAERLERYGAHAIRLRTDGEPFAVTTDRSAFPRPWQAGGEGVSISAAVR